MTSHSSSSSTLVMYQSQQDMTYGPDAKAETKMIAFLIDRTTIRIIDLVSAFTAATIHHDAKIDWLELSPRGTKLVFRDKERKLHLFDIPTQQKTTLLNFCSYCQWVRGRMPAPSCPVPLADRSPSPSTKKVPGSDVLVAQNRNELCVWYNAEKPDNVTTISMKGDVTEIIRVNGQSLVVIDDGLTTEPRIELSEAMIEFGSALEYEEYERCVLSLSLTLALSCFTAVFSRFTSMSRLVTNEPCCWRSVCLSLFLLLASPLSQHMRARNAHLTSHSSLRRAAEILENYDPSPETDAMWEQLAQAALRAQRLVIAERCYAALGNVSRARYLHRVNKQVEFASKQFGGACVHGDAASSALLKHATHHPRHGRRRHRLL